MLGTGVGIGEGILIENFSSFRLFPKKKCGWIKNLVATQKR